MAERRVGRHPQYDGQAEGYALAAEDSPYNAYLDRPAVLELLGDVLGLRVLDAGCGPGLYAEALVARKAQVTGYDQSPDMVRLAARRVGAAEFRVHDLADPLHWLADQSFDKAVLALAIHYLDDRVAPLRELHRVLRPGGVLVVSTGHPTRDWQRHGGSYFDTCVAEEQWTDTFRVRFWRQPLDQIVEDFTTAGFVLERLTEPRPPSAMATRYPTEYQAATNAPIFIAFRLRKPT